MDAWQEAYIQALLEDKTEEALFAVLCQAARDLGFDYCAYGMRVPLPVTRPRIFMMNNYPGDWQQRYKAQNYFAIDPTVAHGIRSVAPLVWSEELFASCPQLREEARMFGLSFGWAQSCYNANGVGGLLTLARSHEPLTPGELRKNALKMSWLAHVAHQALYRCLAEKIVPETTVNLTDREIEVLRWTADGKTSGEVSEIMGITKRTANFHVNNAVAKLGAGNKTAAVIKAAMLGLL